jgi:ribosome-binding factor A
MAKIKIERLQKKIAGDVAEIVLYRVNDPRLKSITITRVELSDDYRRAKVYFTSLGSEAERRTLVRGLEHARGYIQREVASRLATRVTPALTFHYDQSIAKSVEVSQLIDRALAEDEAARIARGEVAPPPAPGAAPPRSGSSEEEE